MQYRKFGKTEKSVSLLGFGCMRLPVVDQHTELIDEKQAIAMIREGIDSGINYVDTAWGYHGEKSEPLVGKALKDGYREKVHLATKLPSWLVQTREDMDKYLNEQLKRLDTECIDFYLVHTLNATYWKTLTENGLFEFLESAKQDGRVKHVGFSFHDELPLFKEIVDAYDWAFCQIQLNFMDTQYQAGLEGLHYAADKGLGVVVMEPLRGGNLVKHVPEDIMRLWKSSEWPDRTPAEWALKYVMDMPEVSVVLSGMGKFDEVRENILTAVSSAPGKMSAAEKDLIDKVAGVYKSRMQVNCTQCAYCMPCPHGVDIPKAFSAYNNAYIYNDHTAFKNRYQGLVSAGKQASKCVACGVCEKACPQHIKIIDTLRRVVTDFE
jgi:hypothetical protein